MRVSLLTFLLILIGLTGCSQSDNHSFHMPGKIPIDAKRWYQLNTPIRGLDGLFDGNQYKGADLGNGRVLENYDAWYPILDGEQMTIDSIMMFDWQGTNEDHPTTIYAVLSDWKRVLIATYTGMRYNGWNGPDPSKPDVYALGKPVSGIRYLVINTWGDLPGELEFYGSYTAPKPFTPVVKKPVPLKNYFGVNAFEWDFLDPADPMVLDNKRLNGIKNFTGFRHYLDWEKLEHKEGSYTFSPSPNGSWNYDTIYQWCRTQGIDVVACIKAVPDWMMDKTPKELQGNENVPVRYGKHFDDPASYIEHAKLAFQYAARYGGNKNIDMQLVHVDTGKVLPWNYSPQNTIRVGLGLITYMECENERDKWWQGRRAYQTGREYAANLSAFYDGNKNTMGPGVGVKNADPEMKVVMAGLSAPQTDYVRGMIDWSLEHRGRRADGSIDMPWDIINYHYYCNDADYGPGKQTSGRAPELTNAANTAAAFVEMAHRYAGDMPVWVTETGYDINQHSPQKAIPIKDKTPQQTQADWSLRTCLLYARAGIQKVFFYELIDDNEKSEGNYGTSGLINGDRSPRPVADYMRQTAKLFGAYTYAATISNNPIVDRYTNNGQLMYALMIPDQKGRAGKYTLDLGAATTAYIYTPVAGNDNMVLTKKPASKGKIDIQVTETPVFVTGYEVK